MELAEQLIESLTKIAPASYESLPDIELYMDQVLEYLSRKPVSLRQDDKLTAAMVNNYTKDGLLPRANGKRYSQEHLAHLILISRLKQVLSVKDTGTLLRANKQTGADQDVYTEFCTMVRHVTEALTASLSSAQCDIAHLAMQLAVESYLSKVACEYLIDLLPREAPKEQNKEQKTPAK